MIPEDCKPTISNNDLIKKAMSVHDYAAAKTCCMIMRIQLDCNACCRKARKILLNMKEIETHMIDKQQRRISVCGRFRPSDVAIKLRKKMNRRVEILEIQEFGGSSHVSNHEHDEPQRSTIPGSTLCTAS